MYWCSSMKKNTLNRYQRTDDNKIRIEITAGKIKYLYNEFDKHAPYVRKELNPDLCEYLIDSVADIGAEDFVLEFRLLRQEDDNLIERVTASIRNYFVYLIERENRETGKMFRTSLIYLFLGLAILSLSFWINQGRLDDETYLSHILTQGLNVAAWVSLWNAIATFLINWKPQRDLIKLYRRIAEADIFFVTST